MMYFLGIVSIVVVLGGLATVLGIYLLAPSSQPVSFSSPNGQKILIASKHVDTSDETKNGHIKFTIKDTSSGTTLEEIVTNAAWRLNWSVLWVNDKKIKLNSSDTGTYCWEETEDSKWVEISC
jgi:hypothetical protein